MKHLEEIIGVNFYEFGFGNEFSDMTLKAWAAKEKNKLDFIKIKKFCASMDIIKKMKRQPMEWKKIFGYHISDKDLISRQHKQLPITQQ